MNDAFRKRAQRRSHTRVFYGLDKPVARSNRATRLRSGRAFRLRFKF